LEEIRRLLKSEETLDRDTLSRFSAVIQRHEWFTGSVLCVAGLSSLRSTREHGKDSQPRSGKSSVDYAKR
jgi:hypothetical protein